jgi:hypothetical protein
MCSNKRVEAPLVANYMHNQFAYQRFTLSTIIHMPKSTKNRNSTSSQPTSSRLRKPFTPLRRFFFKLELLAPSPNVPALLGKRRREELAEEEAGFEHLHAYNYSATVDKALDRSQGNDSSSAPIRVYTPDRSRSRTRKPAGPRSFRQRTPPNPTLPREHPCTISPCATPRPRHCSHGQHAACVALQNIDSTLDDDAVIITALEYIPFNSHEDLLAMSREELVNVAQTLNAKLPLALAIDISDARPFSFIRNAIEVLVGIHPEVPAAPLRTGTMKMPEGENPRFFDGFSFEQQLEESFSPSASPLSMRAKSRRNWSAHLNDMLRGPQRLERLEEVTEEEEGSYRKRRKLSSGTRSNLGFESDVVMQCTSEEATNLSGDFFSLPFSPELREPKQASASLPSYTRVLRSHKSRILGQIASTESTPSTLAVPKGVKAKAKGKARAKRRRQASSGSSERSTDNKRNSVVFPTFHSPSMQADAISHESRSDSSAAASAGSTSGHFASSSAGNSLLQSEHSTDNSGSAFLSIKSTLSSTSKMSVCTGSTKDGTKVKKLDEVPAGETVQTEGLVDMDISV